MPSMIDWVTPMNPSTKFRKTAAKMMIITIAEDRIALSNAAIMTFNVRALRHAARRIAKTTPMEAASVGVANPA